MQILIARCLSWSVAWTNLWARSVRRQREGIGRLIRLCVVFHKVWGHAPKIPQREEKSYVTFLTGMPYRQKQATVKGESKNQLFGHCLLGAKRGARLPRPPLDPPSVGPAASGSECPSNK